MNGKDYGTIISFCEFMLETHGDNYLGVGWTKKQEYADRRYRVMLELIREDASRDVTLLDFGCGASHLYEYILKRKLERLIYSGLDLSSKFLDLSRRKFPGVTYYHLDILENSSDLPVFDYIILNGIFNSKRELPFENMFAYFRRIVTAAFAKARFGIAFNVMSKHVDWEREDLFHLPFDRLTKFVTTEVSRDFVIRHDYGLYEYTTYVYRQTNSE